MQNLFDKIKKQNEWYEKLTDAEKQIWKIIYYNPTMVPDRTSALDMLFCVIGTGLKWIDGEIKDTAEDNYLSRTKRYKYSADNEIYRKAFTNTFTKDTSFLDKLKRSDLERIASYNFFMNSISEHVLKNIKKLTTTSHVPKRFYPICEYSNLITIPKDAKSDWIKLAIETCELVMLCNPEENDKTNARNIKFAKKQKPILIKLLRTRAENQGSCPNILQQPRYVRPKRAHAKRTS